MKGVAPVVIDKIKTCCITGPIMRASGLHYDLRASKRYGSYSFYEFGIPVACGGDNFSRFSLRIEKMFQSLMIIKQYLSVTTFSNNISGQRANETSVAKKANTLNMEDIINSFLNRNIELPNSYHKNNKKTSKRL